MSNYFKLAGYPMKWFDEVEENTDIFFSTPSPSNCPNLIPASWIAACMLFHIQSTYLNSFYFGEVISKTQNPLLRSKKPFGCCLYPTLSLINHSCNPSAGISTTDGGVAFLFARRPLSAGSEIALSYGPTYINIDIVERQSILSKVYLFKCDCEACRNKWDDPMGKPESIKCLQCSSVYQESDRGCKKCESKDSSQILNSLKYKWIPTFKQSLREGTWTADDLKIAANHVELAHSILAHPSETLCYVELFHGTLMNLLHGIRTVEPWTSVAQ